VHTVVITALTLLRSFTPLDLSDESVWREDDRTLSLQLGVESGIVPWLSPATTPHGITRLRYTENALIPGRGFVDVDVNTDTASVAYAHPDLFGPWTYARAHTRLQTFAAGLLTDHTANGVLDAERGFGAGYALAGGMIAVSPVHDDETYLSVRAGVDARQWFHFPWLGTSDALTLPAWSQTVEPALSVWSRRGRRVTPLLRLDGVEAFSDVRLFLQNGRQAYGMKGGISDGRNDDTSGISGRAEGGATTGLLGARVLGLRPSAQLTLRGGVGAGLDDRTRFLVGGDNPYVIPLAGAGWAEFKADRYMLAEARAGLMIVDRVALDVGVHGAVVNDARRTGAIETLTPLSGVFVESEWRPTDDVLVRVRLSKGVFLPRPQGDTGKVFVLVEWRALPWNWS
jgi:hypothetical protein